jgi:hypothetical protein
LSILCLMELTFQVATRIDGKMGARSRDFNSAALAAAMNDS